MKLEWRIYYCFVLLRESLLSDPSSDSSNDKSFNIQNSFLVNLLANLLSENDLLQKSAATKLSKYIVKSSCETEDKDTYHTAQGLLGICLLYGIGLKQNAEQGIQLIKSVKKAMPFARYFLGRARELGSGLEKDIPRALKAYRIAQKHDYPLAIVELARFNANNPNTSLEECIHAKEQLKKILKHEIPEVYLLLGWLYQYRLEYQDKLEKAFKYYQLAALGNNMAAHFNLGVMYSNGWGIEEDQKKAIEHYEIACLGGIQEARYNLGVKHENGEYDMNALVNTQFNSAEIKEGEETTQNKSKRITIISMAPINSSGDIYHIVAWIIRRKQYNIEIPNILLCYDVDSDTSGSKTNTKEQVERAYNFAWSLNLHPHFKNPFLDIHLLTYIDNIKSIQIINAYLGDIEANTLHIKVGASSQPNPRQDNLDKCFQLQTHNGIEIEYIDQRATTTELANAFRKNKQETIDILAKGFAERNPKVVSERAQAILKNYIEYWKIAITSSASQKDKTKYTPVIVLHLRHSSTANSKQDAADGFIPKLIEFLKTKGYIVWCIFADSRLINSFVGIKTQRISPFSPPLKKDKANYNSLKAFDNKLQLENPGFDFGKLKHLELLLMLKSLEFIKGVVGNTSGTFDVGAFIGLRGYDIHNFGASLSYQDYRVLMGLTFLSVENYSNLKSSEKAKKDKAETAETIVNKQLKNFNEWLSSEKEDTLAPTIPFQSPNFNHAGFNTLMFSKVFKKDKNPELIPFAFGNEVQKYVKGHYEKVKAKSDPIEGDVLFSINSNNTKSKNTSNKK